MEASEKGHEGSALEKRSTSHEKGRKPVFIIGVCGGSASGKTTISQKIVSLLNNPRVVLLSMDNFYRELTVIELKEANAGNFNFDAPDAFDWDLLKQVLNNLKNGQPTLIPSYDFSTCRRSWTGEVVSADIILFEGIMTLHNDDICNIMDISVFIDADSDIRLGRRIKRDVAERGRDFDGITEQFFRYVKPAYSEYIAPCIEKADIVVTNNGWNEEDNSNDAAIDQICSRIMKELEQRDKKIDNSASK